MGIATITSENHNYKGIFIHASLTVTKYCKLEGTGAYGPVLLAPVEGLGGPSGPLTCGGIYFNNEWKKIQENPLTFE